MEKLEVILRLEISVLRNLLIIYFQTFQTICFFVELESLTYSDKFMRIKEMVRPTLCQKSKPKGKTSTKRCNRKL